MEVKLALQPVCITKCMRLTAEPSAQGGPQLIVRGAYRAHHSDAPHPDPSIFGGISEPSPEEDDSQRFRLTSAVARQAGSNAKAPFGVCESPIW